MTMTLQEILRKLTMNTATEEDERFYENNYMSEEEREIGKPFYKMNGDEMARYNALLYNHKIGYLKGFNCRHCRNKGDIEIAINGKIYARPCSCMTVRNTIHRMEETGLGNLFEKYTFANYKTTEGWQKIICDTAKAFIRDRNSLFYISGQSGAGKSMICTAIFKEFLKIGMTGKYMLWNDDTTALKQSITGKESYEAIMGEIKRAQCLYIDDFMKREPTAADVNIAFEIINYRYNKSRSDPNRRYITIISTERSIEEVTECDEAIGGRLYEMAENKYYLNIMKDEAKNYRLKEAIE